MYVCLFVCVFVDTKTSSLSETGQFMSSTYYVPVRNRKILVSRYLTNESVYVREPRKADFSNFFALLKLLFNIVDPCQKNDYHRSRRLALLASSSCELEQLLTYNHLHKKCFVSGADKPFSGLTCSGAASRMKPRLPI